jgi:UDP-N-acetylglucosamine 2-epimerase (non-hydrolysing)
MKHKRCAKLLFVLGTRPEAVKLAPLIIEFRKQPDFNVEICLTGQHRDMVWQVLDFFDLHPDYDLKLMRPNQSLSGLAARGVGAVGKLLATARPDVVFVQGDTTTVFAGAVAAYYSKIKVAHIEAGLRTGNKDFPFPEEINRIIADNIANFLFAPTESARDNLALENIRRNVWVTGNTGIDALFMCLDRLKGKDERRCRVKFRFIDFSKKIVLVTCHRRETFGKHFRGICEALIDIARRKDVEIVYPVHLNPNVLNDARTYLRGHATIHLVPPLAYHDMVWLMNKSYMVLTDSSGIQEEAPSLGKPTLVLRNETERQEAVDAGASRIAGTARKNIVAMAHRLLSDPCAYASLAVRKNPFGDGKASARIVKIMRKEMSHV